MYNQSNIYYLEYVPFPIFLIVRHKLQKNTQYIMQGKVIIAHSTIIALIYFAFIL